LSYPEPTEIYVGDTLEWIRRDVVVYSTNDDGELEETEIKASESWTLKYVAVNNLAAFSITASADTDDVDDFKFSVAASTTAAYTLGVYKWQIVATKTTSRYTVADGIVTLLDNLANRSTLYDNRSHAKKMLDAIEAELEGRGTAATLALVSYAIAGRSKTDRVETLIKLRQVYKREYDSEVAAERIKIGLGSKMKILTRFKTPGN
jgi:hypothetical protein